MLHTCAHKRVKPNNSLKNLVHPAPYNGSDRGVKTSLRRPHTLNPGGCGNLGTRGKKNVHKSVITASFLCDERAPRVRATDATGNRLFMPLEKRKKGRLFCPPWMLVQWNFWGLEACRKRGREGGIVVSRAGGRCFAVLPYRLDHLVAWQQLYGVRNGFVSRLTFLMLKTSLTDRIVLWRPQNFSCVWLGMLVSSLLSCTAKDVLSEHDDPAVTTRTT